MRDAVFLTLCSVLSFVPSPQWYLVSLCLVHGRKLTICVPTSITLFRLCTLGVIQPEKPKTMNHFQQELCL